MASRIYRPRFKPSLTAVHTVLRRLRELEARLPPPPYVPTAEQVQHVRKTDCSIAAARTVVASERGNLDAACEHIRRIGLASDAP